MGFPVEMENMILWLFLYGFDFNGKYNIFKWKGNGVFIYLTFVERFFNILKFCLGI